MRSFTLTRRGPLLVGSIAATLTGVPLIYHVHSPAGRDSTRKPGQLWPILWLERRSARRAARLGGRLAQRATVHDRCGFSRHRK